MYFSTARTCVALCNFLGSGQGFIPACLWFSGILYIHGMNGNEHGDKKNICLVNKTEVLTNNPSVVTTLGAQTLCLPPTGPWKMHRVGDPLRTQLKKVYGDLLNVLKHLDTIIK